MANEEPITASPEMEEYFEWLDSRAINEKKIADVAREKGYDPEPFVEIQLAKNMAERVVGLISTLAPQIVGSGTVERIIELEEEYGAQDWRVAFKIAEEIAKEKFCKFESKKLAMEIGVRMGFAYVTVGVVSSPLEGLTEIIIKKRNDNGKEYFCLNFSGPIRNAGGTAASVAVLIADYVRKKMGYAKWDPTENEIKRTYTEVFDYHEKVTNLQYKPSKTELEFLVKNMPLEIGGDPTDEYDVSNFKDLPRTKGNRLRGGMCLIYSSCIPLKSPKLWKKVSKWGHDMDMDQWDFLDEFVKLQKEIKSKGKKASSDSGEKKKENEPKVKPDFTFIADLVAGRPVFGHPLKGFRLRYGRSRLSGYSAAGYNPSGMHIMNDFIATATQLKVERPGKAAAFTPCDSIEGPLVKLNDGSVIQVNTEEQAIKVKNKVKSIIYNGDVLLNYGDFFDRAHTLVPPGYCEEWWALELEKKIVDMFGSLDYTKLGELVDITSETLESFIKNPFTRKPSVYQAYKLSEKLDIPLHPKFTLYWNQITRDQLLQVLDWIYHGKLVKENDKIARMVLLRKEEKEILEILGLEHEILNNEYVVISKQFAYLFTRLLRIGARTIQDLIKVMKENPEDKPLDIMNKYCPLQQRDKAGIFIGARMGRPEKAKQRKMKGSPHGLFPVGEQGGKFKSFQNALKQGFVESSFPIYKCTKCEKETIYTVCEDCDVKTERYYLCTECGPIKDSECKNDHKDPDRQRVMAYSKKKIKINELFDKALKKLDTRIYPDLIKGLYEPNNRQKNIENLTKTLLRSKYNLFVNKDGTIRYDCSEVPMTHFTPAEIDAPVERLRGIGYTHDIHGKDLVDKNQVIELKPQDIVLPSCTEVQGEEPAGEVLLRATKFIDELLVKLYGQKPHYNCKTTDDLIGQLLIGLAPHTSAGILTRVIGFTKTQGFFAHPMIHAAMRRDCDGDESCFFLLMDAFLNFSKKYLPSSRGSTMDACFVLTTKLIPAEVDDMVFNMDMAWQYPLEFYNACTEYKKPWDVKIELLNDNLETPKQYEGYGFTHPTTSVNYGVKCSSYKSLPSMAEKLDSQMNLAEKLRAVDEHDVARLVVEKHFMKDMKGNLRKFSLQQFRCVKCNEKIRRPPLMGKCPSCGGKVIFTISEGSACKYLEPSIKLTTEYNVDPYLRQTVELLKERFEMVFGKDKEKQSSLGTWFG